MKKILLGHTKDDKGRVVNYHPISISHTITTMIGSGWTTDMFLLTVEDEDDISKSR